MTPHSTPIQILVMAGSMATELQKNAPLPGISDDDARKMVSDRKNYLKSCLAKGECFVMDGLNTSYSLYPSHLRPAPSAEMQVLELQNAFVKMLVLL